MKAYRVQLEVPINNTIEEEGLEINGGEPLYPNILLWLLWSFEDGEKTGTLEIPTYGPMRMKAESWSTTEVPEDRGDGTSALSLSLSFVQDNEDSIVAATLASPSISATATRMANETEAIAEQSSIWNGSISEMKASMLQLEALMNSPREMAGELDAQFAAIEGSSMSLAQAFSRNLGGPRDNMRSTGGSRLERMLIKIEDRIVKAKSDTKRDKRKTIAVVFDQDQSLVSISVMLNLDYSELLDLNPQLSDPTNIQAGTPVNIPDDGKIERHG
jgi:hypothetical protein